MNFQSPLSLLWFIPVGAFILGLYFLRLKRKDFSVPASFLWPERQDEVRANSLFQRLKFNWLWVLQLLALLFLVLGLARWQVRQDKVPGTTTVVILDSSASMGSTDIVPSRFDSARKRALEIVNSMQAGDQIAIIESGPVPKVLVGLSQDSSLLKRGLEGLQHTDSPGDFGESIRLAMALVGRDSESRIMILSDGCFEPLGSIARGKAQIIYEPFGKSDENTGIHALGTAELPSGLQAYVSVKNFSTKIAKTALTVLVDGRSIYSEVLEIAGGEVSGKNVQIPRNAETITAKLESGGYLQADDSRTIPANPSASLKVLLVSKGNIFLETGLNLDSRVVLDKAQEVPEREKTVSPGKGSYDLVIFDSMPEVPVKAPVAVTFGSNGKTSLGKYVRKVKGNEPLSLKAEGVLDGVTFEDVYLNEMYSIKPNGGVRQLVASGSDALVLAKESSVKQYYFGFDLLEGDFPLSVSFPILIGNLLDISSQQNTKAVGVLKTGQTLGVPSRGDQPLELVLPNGQKSFIKPVNGRYTLRNFIRVGEYRVGTGSDSQQYFANLINETESNIQPASEIAIAGGAAVKPHAADRFADLWKPLVLALLAVLTLEWIIFMRRS